MGEYLKDAANVWVECKGSVIRYAEGWNFHIGRRSVFPQDADCREDIINKLEHAKNNRRGNLVFFSEEIARKHERGLILREDLKQCIKIDFKGFELFFQPFINPDTGTIAGCESLLRRKGERIKDFYPMEFIKVLEDYGDIHEVGFWVMEQAIKQQAAGAWL